jgi:hypothetical protein
MVVGPGIHGCSRAASLVRPSGLISKFAPHPVPWHNMRDVTGVPLSGCCAFPATSIPLLNLPAARRPPEELRSPDDRYPARIARGFGFSGNGSDEPAIPETDRAR